MTEPVKNRKPEAKVVAGTGGGILGGALTTFILWWLGFAVWDAPSDAAHSAAALAAVPLPVSSLIVAVIPAAFAFGGAYWAPHTHRPDLASEVPSAAAAETIAEAAMRIDVATTHLDERMATHLEQVDADLQHTAPIKPVPSPDMGLRIMDEAHD